MSLRAAQTFIVFGFGSTHHALDAEALLDDMGIEVVPIPTPASLGARCGIALRVPVGQAERARRYLDNAGTIPTSEAEITDI